MREDLGFRNTTPLLWLRHRCAEAAWCKRMTRAGLALSRWGVTATLSICFFMSYLDRLILGLLVEPIKHSFHATDIQIGLLFGATFGVVYALAGIPIGFLVDRGNRKWLIVCGLTAWSLLTISAGFATALQWLFVCRIGVAIGEATLSPAATSMISDLFSPKTRAFPISIFFPSRSEEQHVGKECV